MTTARKYLDILREREPERLKEPLEKSPLTERDIEVIENGLGYKLPQSYKEYLLCYKMPEELTVLASFCGDSIGASFEETFSREENRLVPVPEDSIGVVGELTLMNISGNTGEEFLENLRNEQELIEENPNFLKAGFIQIAQLYGIIIFLDLKTGAVCNIYDEEIYDMTIVEEIDPQNVKQVREYMENSCRMCNDFYDFLRLACTGEWFDEDERRFPTAEELAGGYKRGDVFEEGETAEQVRENAIDYLMTDKKMTREEAEKYLTELLE